MLMKSTPGGRGGQEKKLGKVRSANVELT